MQRLVVFPLSFLASIALSASLAACSSPRSLPAASPTFPLAASPTPNSTALTAFSASPEPTKTPEPEKPAVSHNLSAENARTMVVEGGTWVTKNADGKTTATWDSANSEWVYTMENITMQIGMTEPGYVEGWPATIREGITVTVPNEMLRPLNPTQRDPNPLVPAGYYGTYEQPTTKGVSSMAQIGVDYRGIVLIDEHSSIGTEQYAIVFTIQYKDHPDVMNVLLVPINNTHNGGLWTDLFPAGSTDPGTVQAGPMYDDFIKILQEKKSHWAQDVNFCVCIRHDGTKKPRL